MAPPRRRTRVDQVVVNVSRRHDDPGRARSSSATIGLVASGGDTHDGGLPQAADRELAAMLMAGDVEALAEAYRRFAGLVFGLCRRVLNDDTLAEDVAQEVFVFLWQHPDRFNPSRGSLRSWLALLAPRRSVDQVRAETRRNRAETRIDASTSLAE